MRAVVQRVTQASVTVDGRVVGAIEEPGLVVLVGVTHDDTPDHAAKLAAKLWGLRILDGEKSCSDIGAPLLVISQFTLRVETGIFGADMKVGLVNDGPVTIVLDL